MAVVTRYFSTAAAGAGDGTSWANRAQFVNAGTYSSVITGFSFAGSDSLRILLGPGTHSITSALSLSATAANPCFIEGCDSSGNALTPPDPDWMAAQADFDVSGFPLIDTASNIAFVTNNHVTLKCLNLSSSASNMAFVQNVRKIVWCCILNTVSQSSAAAATMTSGSVENSILKCTGTAHGAVMTFTGNGFIENTKITGNSSASSGVREGVRITATTNPHIDSCVIRNCVAGIDYTSTSANVVPYVRNNVIYNCTTGVYVQQTSQTVRGIIANNMIIGGSDGITADFPQDLYNNRLRGQSNAAFSAGITNVPTTALNYTDSGSDSDEFVDTSTEDFRIKSTSTYYGRYIGAGDQIVAGSSGGLIVHPGLSGGFRS